MYLLVFVRKIKILHFVFKIIIIFFKQMYLSIFVKKIKILHFAFKIIIIFLNKCIYQYLLEK